MPNLTPEQAEFIRRLAVKSRARGLRAQEQAEFLFNGQLEGIHVPFADFRSKRAVRVAARELSLAARAEAMLSQWERE